MNINEYASGDINTHGAGERPPCTGFAPDVLSKVQTSVLTGMYQVCFLSIYLISDKLYKKYK